ncbi:hypothetical protein JMJ77_0002395 [Colletotrichum scovillei]|uniref:Uncharacterized protein n=2 Tax=Colletotrichum scovillei TaxID=1209932 RepID=A0A9P7RB86_9PEZI|nr:hypothetical protein JMJ77_0002395 [Colletotrichum scovillei]KAG7070814.1 hypothetical protein JMJ76_0002059 [Colletotrichum scovillei]KAG7079084.1 hypothetical protein JMJ78_0002745 [Colletotrichum scovillei]
MLFPFSPTTLAGFLPLTFAMGLEERPPQETLAMGFPEHGAGLSPAPTTAPSEESKQMMLEARSLPPHACGVRRLDNGTFETFSCVSNDCYSSGPWFGCRNVLKTECFDGTAPVCQQTTSSLGQKALCCTRSGPSQLPYCMTLLRPDDSGQKTWLRCGDPAYSGQKIMVIGTESDDPDATRTVDPSDTATATSPPSGSSSNSTGAIVGGVVGGVAVVAIAVCVIVWLVLRRRKRSREDGSQVPLTPGSQSQHVQPYYSQAGYGEHDDPYKAQRGPTPSPTPLVEVQGSNVIDNRRPVELGT